MGKFVEHLKRKAESAGCEVIELNAYKLKMSQYDPATDAYRKKPLKKGGTAGETPARSCSEMP